MMIHHVLTSLPVAVVMLALGASCAAKDPAVPRPDTWAKPIAMNGAPNLHQVSPTLYRSAQPTNEGMKNLEARGVRTVLNLRSFNSDEDELKGTGLRGERLTMKAWHPEHKEAVAFLKLANDPAKAPLLVHCQHGADRTGALCALYRVVVQGWTKDEAIREMTEGGFGFHTVWSNLPDWINKLDPAALRKDAGIPTPGAL